MKCLLRPWVLLAHVKPNDSDWKGAGAFNSNHYFLDIESTIFFFWPFLPKFFLFFPWAIDNWWL
jgi:hypothetical protein